MITKSRPASQRSQRSVEQVRREIATAQWKTAHVIWQRELIRWRAMDRTNVPTEDEQIQSQIVAMSYTAARDAYEAINPKSV